MRASKAASAAAEGTGWFRSTHRQEIAFVGEVLREALDMVFGGDGWA